ncbi:protein phosphatase inhibitor [Cooperia oncophora]
MMWLGLAEEWPLKTQTASWFDDLNTSYENNEHLGRLKSNCCCIYTRPRVWDDPTTWEQDEAETEHCRGHTLPPPPKPNDSDGTPSKEPESKDNCHGPCC